MAEAKIGIQVGADIKGLEQGLKRGQAAIGTFERSVKTSTTAINKLPDVSNRAGQSLQNFNRIVQDAPFGLIGIANNIEPALQSFSQLKLETGSTGGALKALGASLLGPQGLVFGISVATSLLITFGDKLFDSGKKAEDAKNKIRGIAEIQGEVTAKLGEERARVETLIAVLENQTTSRQRQKAAIQELNQIAPEYFGNLQVEDGLVIGLTSSYEKYNAAVLSRVRTQVLTEQLIELEKQIVKLEDGSKTAKTFAKAFEDAANNVKTGNKALDIEEAARKRNEAVKFKAIETDKELNKLLIQRSNLLERIRLGADSVDLNISDTKATNIKAEVERLELTPAKVVIPDDYVKIGDIELRVPADRFKNLKVSTDSAKQALKEFADQSIKDLPKIKNAFSFNLDIAGNLESFGESLGQAFADGASPIEAAGKSIIGLIADLISRMGKALIAFGIQKSGLDKILAGGFAIPGGVAIAAGIAAIAAGTLLRQSIPKFAEGGVVNRATLGVFGEAGPEAVIPLNQLGRIAQQITGGSPSGGFIAETRISGNDLLLSVQRTQKQQGISN